VCCWVGSVGFFWWDGYCAGVCCFHVFDAFFKSRDEFSFSEDEVDGLCFVLSEFCGRGDVFGGPTNDAAVKDGFVVKPADVVKANAGSFFDFGFGCEFFGNVWFFSVPVDFVHVDGSADELVFVREWFEVA